jgi:hypothetical protein
MTFACVMPRMTAPVDNEMFVCSSVGEERDLMMMMMMMMMMTGLGPELKSIVATAESLSKKGHSRRLQQERRCCCSTFPVLGIIDTRVSWTPGGIPTSAMTTPESMTAICAPYRAEVDIFCTLHSERVPGRRNGTGTRSMAGARETALGSPTMSIAQRQAACIYQPISCVRKRNRGYIASRGGSLRCRTCRIPQSMHAYSVAGLQRVLESILYDSR